MRVVYVMGPSRSGSTVVGNILGEFDTAFEAGELRFLWLRVLQGRRCGCGEPVERCAVWSRVFERVGEATGCPSPQDVVSWQRSVRMRQLPLLLRAGPGSLPDRESIRRYARLLERTYRAIGEVTGAGLVVDTSKRPPDAALLRLLPDLDLRVLHLVRDPRAIAFSRQQSKPNPDRAGGQMPVRGWPDSVAHWVGTEVAAQAVRRRLPRAAWRSIRYEDVVANPRSSLESIARWLGLDPASSPFVDDRTAQLGANHTASGNPDRFTTGPVALRADDRWLQSMRPADRTGVTAATLPWLLYYGYPVRPAPDGLVAR